MKKNLRHFNIIQFGLLMSLLKPPKACHSVSLFNWHLTENGAAFNFGPRVHYALQRVMLKPPIGHIPAAGLCRRCQVTLDTALTNVNSCQLKTCMEKMATQVDSCLPFNAFPSHVQYDAWKLARLCSMNALLVVF